MDFWSLLMFVFLIFLIMSCCGYCCSTKTRGTVLSTPVVVTSSTHTAPGGYPVTQLPPPGGYQTNVYATPYPAQTTGPQMQMQMPMPQPGVGIPPYPVYPQAGMPGGSMNPPTYDMAVAGAGVGQPNNSSVPGYEKQSPYNPSFTAH